MQRRPLGGKCQSLGQVVPLHQQQFPDTFRGPNGSPLLPWAGGPNGPLKIRLKAA